MKHTALPLSLEMHQDKDWRIVKHLIMKDSWDGAISDGNGNELLDFTAELDRCYEQCEVDEIRANADLIVQAVNSQAELIQALNRAVALLEGAKAHFGDKWPIDLSGTYKDIREALAKATKEV